MHQPPFWRALLAGLALWIAQTLAASPVVRPNVLTLTGTQRTNFCRCVLWMKQHPSHFDPDGHTGLNAYDWLVALHKKGFDTHLSGGSGVHMAPSFFPWHREFLRAFELELQRAATDLGIPGPMAIPYWDWTDPNAIGAVFREDFMGGNGGGPNSAFTSGPAATRGSPFRVLTGFFATLDDRTTDFPIDTSTNVSANSNQGAPRFYLQRSIATQQIFGGPSPGTTPPPYPTADQVAQLPTVDQVRHAMEMTLYDMARWDYSVETNLPFAERTTFRNYMEGHTGKFNIQDDPFGDQLHGRVHLWVGGNLGASSSPNDPLFWLHHANLDRIWAEWQDAHGIFNFPADWTYLDANSNPVTVNAVDPLWGFTAASNYVATVTSLDTLDLRASGVRYDTQPADAPASVSAHIAGNPNGASVSIVAPSIRGLRYQLQQSDVLGGAWKTVGEPIVATADTVTFDQAYDSGTPARLYRIAVTAVGNQPVVLSRAERDELSARQLDPVCGVAQYRRNQAD